MVTNLDIDAAPWRDPAVSAEERVEDLISRMTLEEKVAQLYGVWVGTDATEGEVAPHQHDMAAAPVVWDEVILNGLGQLTRPLGTAPVEPVLGARLLADTQRQVVRASRLGIPALVHEECLTGLAAWTATVFPSPLCWGASFDPHLVERMGRLIGESMRRLGVHQGLAPVLDVVRDLRWGRVEEAIGEDPHLVGTIGAAYVRGLESSGVVATLKHFVGYSASRAGRNLAPVAAGPREIADVLLPPFEMALRAGARSVMNSYTDIDGVPTAADPTLLTALLRETYGFTGTLVADYFSIAFLQTLHGVAASPAEAAALALGAGIDVELPTVNCYGEPLLEALRTGTVEEGLVDRALRRVLLQKCELGLLDPDWSPDSPAGLDEQVTLDSAESRAMAAEVARRSIVLLCNDGTLPLRPRLRLAVVGPRADTMQAMLGCYSFPMHVGVHHPEIPVGLDVPTFAEALQEDVAAYDVVVAEGCPVVGGEDEGIAAAVRAAEGAEVCVAVLGDQAGLFGNGTSGEGCDSVDLRLPGRQEELLEALLGTGIPVVLVLLVGRPYDVSRQADRLAAIVCGFFPGEEGGPALADILSGRVNPSGRLPVSFPRAGGSQPGTYLAAALGQRTSVSMVDPTPLFPFGHGLGYRSAAWVGVRALSSREWATDGTCELEVELRNETDRPVTEVIQVYLHDSAAEVVRPVQSLLAARSVNVPVASAATVRFTLHADLTSFTGREHTRIVEPGEVELRVGASSADVRGVLRFTLTGSRRTVGFERQLHPECDVEIISGEAAGSGEADR